MAYSRSTAIRNIHATNSCISRFSPNLKARNPFIRFEDTPSKQRRFLNMARTYESALRHLDSIQSNRAVTSLFSPPPPTPSSTTKPSPQDLNSQAIPEMLQWAQRAGITQHDLATLRCVHVAGTKGKGSVCAYLTSILTSASAGKVGTYTSPHLVSVRERIQIDGEPLSRALFARYFFEVWDAFTAAARAEADLLLTRNAGKSGAKSGEEGKAGVEEGVSEEEITGPASKPFYFRFLTIMAFHTFLREGVRTAVVECGIGGEFDSTNILPREAVTASVIAQLGVDHVGMLGATVPQIAWHKAGVMKEGVRCFTRKLQGEEEPTMRVLRQRAAEKKAVLVEIEDREVEEWGGVKGDDAVACLEGEFQKYNQALAIRAASEHLRILEGREGKRPEEEALAVLGARFADGLRQARLRGRCETLQDGNFSWFVDGAHTAESLEEVAKWFAAKRKALPGGTKVVLLFNQQERDVAKLLGGLLEGIKRVLGVSTIFDYAVFTRNDVQRRAEDEPERDLSVQRAAADAMEKLCPKTESAIVDNVSEAVDKIKGLQSDEARVAILATGSLHLVGALLRTLEPDGET
ncbi:FolC bifunctional protein [Annulohypoxylon truncatum]|uniref:FolC bifunctional protein n=1 Tax=Annulohypoxylon truncatum TaxID=327061 RepID=UPI002008BBBB|nr:FolC bifunctional protein [Annulohypoxylon truncatum]KAI1204799.1 FolC bifunctional protein [Annulohypoxylon truncatum]